jgi:hypothetical protein
VVIMSAITEHRPWPPQEWTALPKTRWWPNTEFAMDDVKGRYGIAAWSKYDAPEPQDHPFLAINAMRHAVNSARCAAALGHGSNTLFVPEVVAHALWDWFHNPALNEIALAAYLGQVFPRGVNWSYE